MNLASSNLPLIVVFIFILIAFFVFQVIITTREIKQSRYIYKILINTAIKNNEQFFSIIIEVKPNMPSIIPLLDHIYGHQYEKLEILVVIDNNLDNNIDTLLKSYQHMRHVKNLRLIRNKQSQNIEEILQLYGSGKLAMLLTPDNRLSNGFFVTASIESLFNDRAIVSLPWHHICLNNSISSALRVQRNIIRQFITNVFPKNIPLWPLRVGAVYDRQKVIEKSGQVEFVKIISNQKLYVSDPFLPKMFGPYIRRSIKEINKLSLVLISIGIIAFIITSFVFLNKNELLATAIFIFFVYVLTNLMLQLRLGGYSFLDNINLLLVSPFELLFIVVIYICGLMALLIRIILSLFRKSKLLNNSVN